MEQSVNKQNLRTKKDYETNSVEEQPNQISNESPVLDQQLQKRKMSGSKQDLKKKKDYKTNSIDVQTSQISKESLVFNQKSTHQLQKRKLSDEEISLKIQLLQSKEQKLPNEIVELQRLKNNRRKRKSRSQQSIEKIQAHRSQDRENKKCQREKESIEMARERRNLNNAYKKMVKESETETELLQRREEDR